MTITRKLLLINSLICAAFIVMMMVVFFSFRHVEKVLRTSFVSETHRIIENSNMTRELTRVLSDMSLILRTFYENKEVVKTEGLRLSRLMEDLLTKFGEEEEKKNYLYRFMQHITNILAQCKQVNLVRDEIKNIEDNFDRNMVKLDDTIAERLVDLMVQGEDTSDLEQLSSMIGGWRESFIRIKLQFVQLGLEHFKYPMREKAHPMLESTDDLQLRLRTLTAAAPLIAGYGRNLIVLLTDYNASVLKFHRTVEALGKMLEENAREKDSLLLMMERTDREIAKKSEQATDALTDLIYQSMKTILIIFLGILPIAILGGVTAYSIKKPVHTVIEYIRRLSKGEIPGQIEDEYKGEFALVIEYLNMLISTTNSVTQIAESIAAGEMKIVALERSGNDRLMQALNRMIQRLEQIISETRSMIQSVGEGNMDIHGNAEAFEGVWQEMLNGVNDLVKDMGIAVSKSSALSQEMELARNIQSCLLPTAVENIHPEFEIATSMLPADRVGGDFYEITLDRSGNLRLAIGDVSGHGVTPGLIMMMAQTVHSTLVANIDSDTRDTVMKINGILYANVHERLKENHFMTFNALRYLGNGKFEHAGAHLRIIVYHRQSGQCELIRTEGIYLNFKQDISKPTKNSYFELREGDIMVLYTDGLTEARNRSGEMLDMERFVRIVEMNARNELDTQVIKKNIMEDVLNWCDNIRDDDMTLLIVKRKGESDG